MTRKTALQVLGALALVAAINAPAVQAGGVLFTMGGSTQMYTLGNLMAQKFTTTDTNITIQVQPTSSQLGFDNTCAKAIALGMSDMYIQDSQLQEPGCTDMVSIPVAVSAVPVVYNLPGAYFNQRTPDRFTLVHPVRLTPQVIAGIYMGTIKHWNDPAIAGLNPGMALPSAIIKAYNSSEPGGSGFVFNQWLCLTVPSWNAAVGVSIAPNWPVGKSVGTPSSGAMSNAIKSTPYSLGFAGFDYAISYNLQAAALKNASGVFLTPSLNGLSRAIAHQLGDPSRGMPADFRREFVDVPGKDAFNPADFEFYVAHRNLAGIGLGGDTATAIKTFLNWAVSPQGGQQFIEQVSLRRIGGVNVLEHGFVPVPPEILEASQRTVNSLII